MPTGECLMPDRELAKGCKIIHEPPFNFEVKKREGTLLLDFPMCEKQMGLHQHDVKAEKQTLCNRHLFATPLINEQGRAWKLFQKNFRWLSRQIGYCRVAPMRTLIEGRNGKRRNRFWLGIQRYLLNGVSKKDAKIKEMQKLEFYDMDVIPKKEDRGIQFRSVQYNAALARQLHNMEARLIGMHPHGYHPIMKSATPKQMAERLFWAASRLKDPVFLLNDYSRFDCHVQSLIKKESGKHSKRCRNYDPEACRLLDLQLEGVGKSDGGIVYTYEGKIQSGDVDTSKRGNEINYVAIRSLIEYFNIPEEAVYTFINGDDSFFVIEREYLPDVERMREFMLELGLKAEFEVVNDIFKVEFCQSRPVILPGGVTFCRNPEKVMATLGRSAERLTSGQVKNTVRASAMCEIAMADGAPVISPLAQRVLKHLGSGTLRYNASMQYKMDVRKLTPSKGEYEPDLVARHTMARAWDIDPARQIQLEQQPLIWNTAMMGGKEPRDKVKPLEVYEISDMGDIDPVCGCGACPEYEVTRQDALRWY